MITASAVTNSRIHARKARLQLRDTQKVEARIASATRGKSGFEADLARLNAFLNGVCDNLRAVRCPVPSAVVHHTQPAPRRTHRTSRSSAKSGDSNDAEPPEPERPLLYDESSLAALLCISKKTLQNIYSKTPHLLPPAIQIPGARGPRWTPASVEEWLSNRPKHTPKTVPVALKKKVGRPRIALAVKGVQS